MAIYDLGSASLAANGEVAGVGTTWKAPLTLIRVGATIVFKTEPVQIYTISEIISDTQINVYNPNSETVPAGTGYAILAHDGITVQGLAQDVAETLRYYQSRETEVADAVDAFNNFDSADFESKITQVNTQHGDVVSIGAQVSADAIQVSADKNEAAESATSASLSKDAAAVSAQEAADYAASLDTQGLLRKDLAFSDLTDKQLGRQNLDVYSKSEVDRAIKISSGLSVNVAYFGAVGDWNQNTQSGTDNTTAFQNAINYMASIPTIYDGGVRELYIPAGNYLVGKLTFPSSIGFGVQIRGEGPVNTRLFCHSEDTVACLLFNVGYIQFTDIEILGSKKRNSSVGERSKYLIDVSLSDGTPDCDVRISNTCYLGSAETIIKMTGRGLHCNGALLFFAGTFLEINCAVSNFGSGNNTAETGMRNYAIIDNRFDTVSVGVRVVGTGVEKDFINDVKFEGNDIFQMDRVFVGKDCTLQSSSLSKNSALGSFAYGFVEVKRIVNSVMEGNLLRKFYNRSFNPSTDSDYMHGILSCTGSADGVSIINNSISYNTLHVVSVGANSSGVIISGNNFQESFLTGGYATIFKGANCNNLLITNNVFRNSSKPTLTVNAIDTSVQTSGLFAFTGNQSSFKIGGTSALYTPSLKYGGASASTAAITGKYNVESNKVNLSVQFASLDMTTGSSSDEISVTLPVTPVADSTITSLFSGYGSVVFTNGGVPSILRCVVVPGGDLYFIKTDGQRLRRSDVTSTYSIFVEVSYMS